MYTIIHVLLFASRVVHVFLQSCDYVGNLGVNYREAENINNTNWNFIRIRNCISDQAFNGKTIVHVWITGGTVPKLEKNFIANMEYLKEIYIEKLHIETIQPGAFSNLPRLEKININTNPIKTILRGLFDILPSLQVIHIYNNKLLFIEDHSFANLPYLTDIVLNENNLNYMKREWFTNTTNIENFSMFRNSVRKVPRGMFHGWRSLKAIHLNSNAISVIEGKLFKDNSPFMTSVGLHQNRLASISPKTFPDSVYMGYFAISANLLNYLPEEFLKKIRVGNIAIYGNPFKCPCLEKINSILLEKGVTVDDPVYTFAGYCKNGGVPVCGFSSNSSRTCTENVDKDMTKRFISYMKKVRFDTVYDSSGQQCAMFDEFE